MTESIHAIHDLRASRALAALGLEQHGVIVVRMLGKEELEFYRTWLHQYRMAIPECKTPNDKTIATAGLWLSLPSSFHHPFARSLRMREMMELIPLFGRLVRDYLSDPEQSDEEPYRLTLLPDRIRVLEAGRAIAGETWHRDIAQGDDKQGRRSIR